MTGNEEIVTQLDAINACILLAEDSNDLTDAMERMNELKQAIIQEKINKYKENK